MPRILCHDNQVRDLPWPKFYKELDRVQRKGFDPVVRKSVVTENMTRAEKLFAINKELGMHMHGIICNLPLHDPAQDNKRAATRTQDPHALDVLLALMPTATKAPDRITFPAYIGLAPKIEAITLPISFDAGNKKNHYQEAMLKFKAEHGITGTAHVEVRQG